MVGLVGNIQNQFCSAYDWAGEVGATVQQQVSNQITRTKTLVATTCHSINQGCQDAASYTKQKCLDTAKKIETFLYDHKETIFFTGCTLATAYFAPHLFFSTLVVTIILRVELAHNLKKMADYYLKDDRNPYKINPKYDTRITTFDVTLGTISAIDAIALGTLFMTNSWCVALLPALGGLAAGNCAAKIGMNIANLF
jgi:hypothetical protein